MYDDEVSKYEHMYDDDGVDEYERLCAAGLLDNEVHDEDELHDNYQWPQCGEILPLEEAIEICARRWSI